MYWNRNIIIMYVIREIKTASLNSLRISRTAAKHKQVCAVSGLCSDDKLPSAWCKPWTGVPPDVVLRVV